MRQRTAHRPPLNERVVPTGSLGLDLATGLGGFPRGHLSELAGPPASGKTTVLYSALAATQHAGGLVALVDAAGTADGDTLTGCGLDLAALILAQPASAPDALLYLTILARCGALDLLALTSIPALRDLPAGRLRTVNAAVTPAYDSARLLARGLRVLTAALRNTPTAVVVTNERDASRAPDPT